MSDQTRADSLTGVDGGGSHHWVHPTRPFGVNVAPSSSQGSFHRRDPELYAHNPGSFYAQTDHVQGAGSLYPKPYTSFAQQRQPQANSLYPPICPLPSGPGGVAGTYTHAADPSVASFAPLAASRDTITVGALYPQAGGTSASCYVPPAQPRYDLGYCENPDSGGLFCQVGLPIPLQTTGESQQQGSWNIGDSEGHYPGAQFQTSSRMGHHVNPGPFPNGPYIQFEQQMPTSLVSSVSHQPHSSVSPQGGVPGQTSTAGPANVIRAVMGLASKSNHYLSAARFLLHGTLDVMLYEAVNLPNMDLFSEKLRQFVSNLPTKIQKVKAKASEHNVKVITSDPYAIVILAGARVARTRVINNNVNPKWNEHFVVPVAHFVYDVQITLKDQDILGSKIIGDVKIPIEQVLNGDTVEGWYDILNPKGENCHQGAKLHVSVHYLPVEKNSLYTTGLGDGNGVPCTYFPLRRGCKVSLYQDTHIYENTLPEVYLDGNQVYHHKQCWEEMCTAIMEACHLVYIAGWSVYDKVKLIRDRNRPFPETGNLTLGELLKKKAGEGVCVLLLIWNDKTSHDNTFFKTDGVMKTHDEETRKFFKHSGVRCVLAARYGDSKLSWFRQQVVGTLYSHHQKLMIVDSQGPRNMRKLTSFIGGLDLCDGRWDTPLHHVFNSLQNEHKDDFYNKSFPCWRKATRLHDDELVNIDKSGWILGPSNQAPLEGDPAVYVTDDYDEESWHVQVFRSIDGGSVKGFPKTMEEVQTQHLVWGKSIAIDVSIQMAYVKAIRMAQHFIYIENQYFLGSSYNWPDYDVAGANHLIPMELTLKICSKIRAGQRFAVYIVVPMFPEGIPDSGPVQEILYFQSQTMKMMYFLIADAIRDSSLNGQQHPQDYLNFFCLGNREVKSPLEPEPVKPPDLNSKHGQAQKNRRFMIYVHSKGMIVDDELVILGSANINQRSMDGSRDTEIAMGGYQPHHTWAHKCAPPHGQVHGYRMSLWAEHLGVLENTFLAPETLECVHRVNQMAEANWLQYTAPTTSGMRGHLMVYPLMVKSDGSVTPRPGHETFPDVGGKVMGSNQLNIPDDLTA
ncbi:hypothetical protein CY35_04G109300 [Sphagnum magellanicum]|nr:hypothetical protein CY35_04G109300 [Sphagnum magellanicum]